MRRLGDGEAMAGSVADPELFMVVFERHYAAIARYLARRLPPDVAADLASETFVRAFAARARFEPSRDDALPFLYGIAANLIRRHRRSEERMLRAYARAGAAASARETAELSDTAALAAVLRELRPVEREVLLLYAWAGLDYEQIAQALEIPVGTVRSRLSRTRRRLRERVEPPLLPTREEAPRCTS